jgi:toxin ParE1/3/4
VRLRVTRREATQIERALDYIEAESPQGANRMRDRIATLFLLLAEHPYAGQATDLPGVRRLFISPYPYLIFYRVTGDEVIVSAGTPHIAPAPLWVEAARGRSRSGPARSTL